MQVTVPRGCQLVDDAFEFEIDADPPGEVGGFSAASLRLVAGPGPSAGNPGWDSLWAFPIALVAAVALALALMPTITRRVPSAVSSGRWGLGTKLNLDKSWTFKDSWVSNVTIGAGVLTGVLASSDAMTALFGDDAGAARALAAVSAAVAAAFIAAGPLIARSTKSRDDKFTVGGLLAASIVTLAGALGEVWVIFRLASGIDFAGADLAFGIGATAGALLLGFYALRTTTITIGIGTALRLKEQPAIPIPAARAGAPLERGLDLALESAEGTAHRFPAYLLGTPHPGHPDYHAPQADPAVIL